MPDIVQATLKWIGYHRYSSIAGVLCIAVLVFIYTPGCQSTAPSPLTGKASTADQLVAERDAKVAELITAQKNREANTRNLLAQVQAEAQTKITSLATAIQQSGDETAGQLKKLNDQYAAAGVIIENKDHIINEIYTTINSSGLANQIPGGALVLGTIGTIFGLGATADNRRKNSVIAALKTGQPLSSPAGA